MKVTFLRLFFMAALAAGITITAPVKSTGAVIFQEDVIKVKPIANNIANESDSDQAEAKVDGEQVGDDASSDGSDPSKPKMAGYEFEKPFRVEADGQPVAVESPGYACPTMADVDGDGVPDLVVGQFRAGNMQFFRNLAGKNQPPQFAAGQWLMTDENRAVVPGVW